MVNKKIIDTSLKVQFMGNSNLISNYIPKSSSDNLPRISELKKDKLILLEKMRQEKEAIRMKQSEYNDTELLKSSTATVVMGVENPLIKKKETENLDLGSIPKFMKNILVTSIFAVIMVAVILALFNNKEAQLQNSNQIITNDLITSVENVIVTNNEYEFNKDTLDDGKNVVLTLKNKELLLSYKVPLMDNPNIDYMVYKDKSLTKTINFKPTYTADKSKVKHLYIYLSKDMYDVVKSEITK